MTCPPSSCSSQPPRLRAAPVRMRMLTLISGSRTPADELYHALRGSSSNAGVTDIADSSTFHT